jgi:RHS repeat-associated protein
VGELVGITHTGPLGTIDARTYVYDAIGRRTSETGPEGTHVFAYDSLSQLAATTRPSGYPHPSTTFTYDANGNRLTSGAVTYVSNALDQYLTVGGVTQTHDDAGNLTNDGATAYTYDAENRLIAASGPGGNATYGYDALGRRVRKSVGASTIRYVHDGEQIIQELDASGAVQATWRYGIGLDEPLSIERSGQTHWYLADPIGSIRALTDGFGAVAESYLYDAFGAAAIFDGTGTPIAASALGNPYLFTARQVDPETGLFHYRARAYSPTTGRFLQRDPLGQEPDVNVYRYCGNHPLDSVDPLGLDWFNNVLYHTGNFSSGFADQITFGGTRWLRNKIGAKGVVNERSGLYVSGRVAGVAWQSVMGNSLVREGVRLTRLGTAALRSSHAAKGSQAAVAAPSSSYRAAITGFRGSKGPNPYHGLDRAIERGVKPREILDAVRRPAVEVAQGGGRTLYLTPRAAVVLDARRQVVTVWGAADHSPKTLDLLRAAGAIL